MASWESWQGDYIRIKKPELQRYTKCTEKLYAALPNTLVETDIEEIQACPTSSSRSYMFYDIVEKKYCPYPTLIQALIVADQIRAAKILIDGYRENSREIPHDIRVFQNLSNLQYQRGKGIQIGKFLPTNYPLKIVTTPEVHITRHRILSTPLGEYTWAALEQIDNEYIGDSSSSTVGIYWKYANLQDFLDKALRNVSNRKTVVLVSEPKAEITSALDVLGIRKECFEIIGDNFAWNDLTKTSQEELLQEYVTLQGNKRIQLGTLLNDLARGTGTTVMECLRGKTLFSLVNNDAPSLCGISLPEQPTYYVPREINARRVISGKVLTKLTEVDNVLAVSNFTIRDLPRGTIGDRIQAISVNDITDDTTELEANIVFLEDDGDFDWLCEKYPTKTFHWLKYEELKEKHAFYWRKSYNQNGHEAVSLIQQFVTKAQDVLDENSILDDEFTKHGPVLIGAPAGMGKSALLSSISKRLIENQTSCHVVGYMEASELLRKLQEQNIENVTCEQVLEIILDKMEATEFFKKLMTSQLHVNSNERKIEVMLDDVDYALDQPEHRDLVETVIRLLSECKQLRLWATTRQHRLREMEAILNVIGWSVLPLDENSQEILVTSLWREKIPEEEKGHLDSVNKLIDFGKQCLYETVEAMGSESKSDLHLLGTPMQCVVFAEALYAEAQKRFKHKTNIVRAFESFINKFKKPKPMKILVNKSVTQVYSNLVDRKFEAFWKKIGRRLEPPIGITPENAESHTKEVMKKLHMSLAIQSKFPEYSDAFQTALSPPVSGGNITSYGMVFEDVNGTDKFYLKTLEDYFVALFIAEIGITTSSLANQLAGFLLNSVLKLTPNYDPRKDGAESCPGFENNLVVNFLNGMLAPAQHSLQLQPSDTFSESLARNWIEGGGETREGHSNQALTVIVHSYTNLFRLLRQVAVNHANELKQEIANFPAMDYIYFGAKYLTLPELLEICKSISNVYCSGDMNKIAQLGYNRLDQVPLHAAVQKGDVEMVRHLIHNAGFHVDIWEELRLSWDSAHRGVLHYCTYKSKYNDEDTIKNKKALINKLLSHSLSPGGVGEPLLEERDISGRTPLLQEEAHFELIMHLLTPPPNRPTVYADISAKDNGNTTVLHSFFEDWCPSDTNFTSSVMSLIEKAHEENMQLQWEKNGHEETLLHIAARTGNLEGVKLLVQTYHLDVNAVDSEQHTPLQLAYLCPYNKDEIIRFLNSNGAQICGKGGNVN